MLLYSLTLTKFIEHNSSLLNISHLGLLDIPQVH